MLKCIVVTKKKKQNSNSNKKRNYFKDKMNKKRIKICKNEKRKNQIRIDIFQ